MSRDDVLRLLTSVDWSSTRTLTSSSSNFVPDAFRRLIDARTEADADDAYWQLDNRVVVQGRLFEASEKLIAPLLAALELELSLAARHRVVELLTEIALGETGKEELAVGNTGLAEASRAEIRSGLSSVYKLLEDPDPRVRRAALHILDAVELDRRRLAAAAATVARTDSDEEARAYARENLVNGVGPGFHERRAQRNR